LRARPGVETGPPPRTRPASLATGQTGPVDDRHVVTGPGPGADTPDPAGAEHLWPLDAALGAATLTAGAVRTTAAAVASSQVGRAAAGVARRLAGPLSERGREIRTTVEREAGPTAGSAISRVVPGVVDAVGLDGVLASVDVDALIRRVDVDGIVSRVDVGGIVSRVDVDRIVSQVDLDALLARLDVDALMARVDVGALLERVDLDALLDRIDLDALISRLDLNAVLQRLDIDELVSNTELGSIIAQSTSGVASEALDAVRSQGVGLDNFLDRLVNRISRRDPASVPVGPPLLVGASDPDGGGPGPATEATAATDGSDVPDAANEPLRVAPLAARVRVAPSDAAVPAWATTDRSDESASATHAATENGRRP
jgi:hypothetical protein